VARNPGKRTIKTEWDELFRDSNYGDFRPLLYRAEPLMNKAGLEDAARAVISLVRALGDAQKQGLRPQNYMNEIAGGGFFNSALKLDGSLFQSQKGIVVQIVKDALPEIKLPDPSIEVFVVLLAMTKAEVGSLLSNEAFAQEQPVLNEDFNRLAQHLEKTKYSNWNEHYGASAEEWRPMGGPKSIASIIRDALETFNLSKQFSKRLEPKFLDIRTLDNTTPEGRTLLKRLRKEGCIVIADVISIRHPIFLRAFQQSLLDVFPTTCVVSIAPDANVFDVMRTMVQALQMNFSETEFNFRLHDPVEGLACHESANILQLAQWLIDRVRLLYATTDSKGGIRGELNK
jgi:hypothetical protein